MREVVAFERSSYFKNELFRPIRVGFALEQMAMSNIDTSVLEEFMSDSCKKQFISFERFLGRIVIIPTGKRIRGDASFKGKSYGNKATQGFLSINNLRYRDHEPSPVVIEKLWENSKQTLVSY